MESKTNPLHDLEFFHLVKTNKVKTPNEFSIGMGSLIRAAREERGMSQVDLAKEINRRPATISLIENGKSEISVITLMLFAISLQKPISNFFPPSLLKDWIVDIKTPFEQKCLELLRGIEQFGDEKFTLDLLKLLQNHFLEDIEAAERGFPLEEDSSDE